MSTTTRYYRYLQFLIPFALVSLSFFGLLPCPLVMAAPVITLSASSGPVGGSITVNGSVFDSYEGDTIHILFDDIEFDNSPLTIPAGGEFSFTAVIPVNAVPGQHTIGVKRETTDSSVFMSVPFTVQERALAVNAAQGHVDADISISGSGFCAGRAVTLVYYNPAAGNIGTVTASPAGTFTFVYTIPAGTGGIHKITASNDAGNTAEVNFKVVPEILVNTASASPGEWLIVMGSGFGANHAVNISFDTTGAASAATGSSGSFETDFIVPALPVNIYSLKAEDAAGNSAQVSFPVTAGVVFSQMAGAVGDPVTVTGDSFEPDTPVTVLFDDAGVANGRSNAAGDFTLVFSVPPCKGGGHTISVSDGATTRRYTFSVETQAPPPPVLLLPAHNDLSGAYVHFTWQSVIDPSVPVTYDLEIAAGRDFANIVYNREGITANGYTLGAGEALAADATDSVYFWRMSATDGAGNWSGWSEIQAFYIDFLTAPSLMGPAEGAELKIPVTLSWEAVTDSSPPVTYNLQISRNPEYTALLVDEKGITAPSFSIAEESRRIFTSKYTYYWRVKAVDNAGNASGWSVTGSFRMAPKGFPAWAAWTLAGVALVILGLFILRNIRRKTYH